LHFTLKAMTGNLCLRRARLSLIQEQALATDQPGDSHELRNASLWNRISQAGASLLVQRPALHSEAQQTGELLPCSRTGLVSQILILQDHRCEECIRPCNHQCFAIPVKPWT